MTDSALDALLKSQPALWRGRDQYNTDACISTGFDKLNNALPSRGWSIGCLTELLIEQQGIGEFSLLLPALQQITAEGQWAALVNPPYIPYAPALANAQINLERLLIIDSGTDAHTLWATEQVLRAGIFAAVVAWVERSSAQKQRRLQIAAETGGTWATVFRPASARTEHSPAALRIVISNADNIGSDHLSLDIFKSRGSNQQTVSIDPIEFDQPQGVEWPGFVSSESCPLACVSHIS